MPKTFVGSNAGLSRGSSFARDRSESPRRKRSRSRATESDDDGQSRSTRKARVVKKEYEGLRETRIICLEVWRGDGGNSVATVAKGFGHSIGMGAVGRWRWGCWGANHVFSITNNKLSRF